MLLPVGAYVQIVANKFYEDGTVSGLKIPAYLISRFSVDGKLAYFFRPHDFIGQVRVILAWREKLPIIESGEYDYLPRGWKKKSEKESRIKKPYYSYIRQPPTRLILNNFRRQELLDIINFYRMGIHIGDRTKNIEMLEQIQKHFTFAGIEKRNVKSLSCTPQEGVILIDDRILDLDSINEKPCWIHVNRDGTVERDGSVGLREDVGYFFNRYGTKLDKEGKMIEEPGNADPGNTDDGKDVYPAKLSKAKATVSSVSFAPPKRPRRDPRNVPDGAVQVDGAVYTIMSDDVSMSHFIDSPSFTFKAERVNITPSEDEEDEEARGEE